MNSPATPKLHTKHEIIHYYQPTNHSCSQAALAILLSSYDDTRTPEQLIEQLPVLKGGNGEDFGSINQRLATWCISQGYEVEMHTADFEVIDLSWASLDTNAQLERMKLAKQYRKVPSIGKMWTDLYMQSYIDFLEAGGSLYIHPYMTTKLIDDALMTGPLLICVCNNVLFDGGRSTHESKLRDSTPDDLEGKLFNHSVVLYGKNKQGTYLIADPWRKPGFHEIEPERLLAAMTSAQMECDNLFFQLKLKEKKT